MNNYWKVFVTTLFVYNNKILALKRKSSGYYADYYDFPGGKMEFGENIENAAQREILEEIGYSIDKNKLVLKAGIDWVDEFENETRFAVCFCFVYNLDKEIKITINEKEHVDYKWVEKNDPCLDKFLVDIINKCEL